MTRQETRQRGVTLVEVMLTLAITAMLLLVAFAGRASIRSNTEFITGIDQVKEQLLTYKSQASTVSNATGSGGSFGQHSGPYLVLGDAFELSPSSGVINQVTLLCTASGSPLGCDTSSATSSYIQVSNPTSYTMPWGIIAPSSSPVVTVVFERDPSSNALTGCVTNGITLAALQAGSVPTQQLLAGSSTCSRNPVTLNLAGTSGLTGRVMVDPAAGTITRSIP